MRTAFDDRVQKNLQDLKDAGTFKTYRHLSGPMDAHSGMEEAGKDVLVLSSNNYLGLSNDPEVIEASREALNKYGAGTASVRFICGTMSIHKELEDEIADFHSTEASLTYSSCWSANTGLFANICAPGDALISDELNHASIIDGCRVVNKQVNRDVYRHSDMAHLEEQLQKYKDAPARFIVTDGVFSMEGDIAKMPEIVALAEKYEATLIVDDSHGVGVMGPGGRGVAEFYGVEDKVDIYTGTLGKALGGAAGGYVAGPQHVIDLLIQQSRPHIFSNGISPATAGAAMASIRLIKREPQRVKSVQDKSRWFRDALRAEGFSPLEGESAIVPIIVGDTAFAMSISEKMLKEHGIFVTGFGFPVVPKGTARIRVQISDAMSQEDLDYALKAFVTVGKEVGLLEAAA